MKLRFYMEDLFLVNQISEHYSYLHSSHIYVAQGERQGIRTSRKEAMMTRNEIAYSQYLEQSRHNLAEEQETAANNQRVHYGNMRVIGETNRHNLATETEANRSNRANEAENKRANQAREKEQRRSNKASEKLGRANLKETKRHNIAGETTANKTLAETNRHNVVTETETNRSNIANEGLIKYRTDTDAATSKYVADKNAAASKYAADAAASASKYAQDMANYRNSNDNATKEQIANEDRSYRAQNDFNNRWAEMFNSGNNANVNKARNEIESQKAKAQEDYNNKRITQGYFKILMDFLNSQLNRANDILKVLPKTGGSK